MKKLTLSLSVLCTGLMSMSVCQAEKVTQFLFVESTLGSVSAAASGSSASSPTAGFGLGYRFNPNFAVIGKYQTLYKESGVSSNAVSARVMGILPISREFSLNGKVGLGVTTFKNDAHSTKGNINFGIGADYLINRQVSLGLDVDFYSTPSDTYFKAIQQTNIGLTGKFNF